MKSQRQRGFTIVELLITLFVASILLAIAVPSFQTLIRNNRLTAQINTFVTSLQYARTEAIRRNAMVSIGAQNAGNNANEWGPGWRVWVDTNRNGVEDGGELALKVESALTDNNTLNGPDGLAVIQYLQDGGVVNIPGDRKFSLCHASGLQGRELHIARTGRISTDRDYVCP